MKYPFMLIIKFYKKFISPLLPPRCKFYPSCSSYSLSAFEKHGFFKGFVLMVWRILRCNPWSLGGVDYVPEKFCMDYFRKTLNKKENQS